MHIPSPSSLASNYLAMSSDIFVVPAFGQGHLLPCIELCKHLASLNFKTTLLIFSNLYSSIPVSFIQYPLIEVAQIQSPPPSSLPPFLRLKEDKTRLVSALESLLSTRTHTDLPVCAVVDVAIVMEWTVEIFGKFKVPTIGFFTSSACSVAVELATWKYGGDFRLLPGLLERMALTESDLKRRPGGPNGGGGGNSSSPGGPRKIGPPNPLGRPQWVDDVEESIALMINTCDDLERPLIRYLANEVGKPVWGVGPLLPELYWKSAGSLVRDGEIRPNRKSNVTEDEVISWLDSKPKKSVLYISFGTELGPEMDEYPHLANALEEWTGPFIWVIQPGPGRLGPPRQLSGSDVEFPSGFQEKVGERGLIISGWAPQLLILSHPSTGGFLSHCGWNSTMEAIVRGVPFLAWPILDDQVENAKLVVNHMKIGYIVSDVDWITKDNLTKGIERLMGDEEMKGRAAIICSKFKDGFPSTSLGSLDAFKNFINQRIG
ncbi:UDP-glycosyltransferase 73C4 isoform X2 [Jatropha curcas]|uniref:UDP-glycosyltransferase 73C4 isoform X2 n=1 Tax=Jatropha curcas TaxID=180498 RepID=UPI001895CE52|nr:UDP-glycosyltransferase 73C4 isoform X2 [Jatropha curcas]